MHHGPIPVLSVSVVGHQAVAHILAYLQLNRFVFGEGLAVLLLLMVGDATLLG